jgi:hypothetical protein
MLSDSRWKHEQTLKRREAYHLSLIQIVKSTIRDYPPKCVVIDTWRFAANTSPILPQQPDEPVQNPRG